MAKPGLEDFEPGYSPGTAPLRAGNWSVPCGQCEECRLDRVRDLAACARLELAAAQGRAEFVTLTFDDAHYPDQGSVDVRTVQLFLKRLRQETGPFRYLGVGEYGGQFGRPHYHLLIFGYEFANRVSHAVADGGVVFRAPLLEKVWPFGFSTTAEVLPVHVNYCAGYAAKKLFGSSGLARGVRYDALTGEPEVRRPEFHVMSKVGGFGVGGFADRDAVAHELIRTGTIRALEREWEGPGPAPAEPVPVVIPKCVMRRVAELDPDAYVELNAQRAELAEVSRVENPPEFRASRRRAAAAERRKLKPLKVGPSGFAESREDYSIVDEGFDAAEEIFSGRVNPANPFYQVAGLTEAHLKRSAEPVIEQPKAAKKAPQLYAQFGVVAPVRPKPKAREFLSEAERERRNFARECVKKARDLVRRELRLAAFFRDLAVKSSSPIRRELLRKRWRARVVERLVLERWEYLATKEQLEGCDEDALVVFCFRLSEAILADVAALSRVREEWAAVSRGMDRRPFEELVDVMGRDPDELARVREVRAQYFMERKALRIASAFEKSGLEAALWLARFVGRPKLPFFDGSDVGKLIADTIVDEHGVRKFADVKRQLLFEVAREELYGDAPVAPVAVWRDRYSVPRGEKRWA